MTSTDSDASRLGAAWRGAALFARRQSLLGVRTPRPDRDVLTSAFIRATSADYRVSL